MKNKGFTMVELLAVIAILGIMTGLAMSAYTRYKESARNKGYDIMASSAISGAESYIMDNPAATEVNFDTLVNNGYLEDTIDPADSNNNCTGTVRISKQASSDPTKLNENSFVVDMCCSNINYQYNSNGRKAKTSMCHAEFNSEKYIENNKETNCNEGNIKTKSFNIYTMDYLRKFCNKSSGKYSSCSDSVANLPCRQYEYHQYKCVCNYSKISNKYCSSDTPINNSSSHTMKIRYYENADGKAACNSDAPGSFNSYVSQVCTYGTYASGKDVMTFHGYQFFKAKSVGYTDFRPEGTWFHDQINGVTLEDRVQRKNTGNGITDAQQGCKDTCIRFTEALSGKVD